MVGRGVAGLLSLVVLLSGCLEDLHGGVEDSATPPVDNAGSGLDLKPVTGEVQPRTLDAAPDWKSGEWWKVKLVDQFTGSEYEGMRVVTGEEAGNFLVGMPADEWRNELMVMHIPGFGEIQKDDLSFEIHDARFAPLNFPLTMGKTWETEFEGRAVNAEVTSVEGQKATVHLVSPGEGQPNDDITVTYDAGIGEIVHYEGIGYATYDVLGHGFGFEGIVTVPHMHDLIFVEFRLAGVLTAGSIQGFDVQPPMDTVEVDSTYDRVSFAIILGTVLPDYNGPPAYYNEKVTAPDGTVYEDTALPTEPGLKIRFYQHDQPGGTWKFEHVAAGPGIALTEGIAYHVYDVVMPEGRVLPSTGEHEHGG